MWASCRLSPQCLVSKFWMPDNMPRSCATTNHQGGLEVTRNSFKRLKHKRKKGREITHISNLASELVHISYRMGKERTVRSRNKMQKSLGLTDPTAGKILKLNRNHLHSSLLPLSSRWGNATCVLLSGLEYAVKESAVTQNSPTPPDSLLHR